MPGPGRCSCSGCSRKVVSVGQLRRIDSKFGGSLTLCDAVVGDETGTVVLSLWEGQIDGVADGDILQVNNGYVSLVRGHMRLNVGKYGSLETVTREVPEVNKANDPSAAEHDMPPRESGGGFRGGSDGRSGGDGHSFGRQREEPRIHRRRFQTTSADPRQPRALRSLRHQVGGDSRGYGGLSAASIAPKNTFARSTCSAACARLIPKAAE